jgi:branched-chain amino acid transport system permease protein
MSQLLVTYRPLIEFILLNAALALSVYITLSAGLLSLANAGFMAIGAYTSALLYVNRGAPALGIYRAAPVLTSVILAIAIAAVAGYLFGRPLLRLRDVYLAIATLGFGEIVRILATNGDALVGIVRGMPAADIGLFNGAEGIRLTRLVTTWHLVTYLVVLVYLFVMLRRSRFGRVIEAIRADEAAAATMGIDVVRYKTFAFTLSAMIAAGAGALNAPLIRLAAPGQYDFARAVELLTYVVLGGAAHWSGALVGAALLTALPEILRGLKEQREIVNGVILMLAIIYLPRGLADPKFWGPRFRRRRARPERRASAPARSESS